MLSSTTGVLFYEQLESTKVTAANWCPEGGSKQDYMSGDSHCLAGGGWAGRFSLFSVKKADGRMAG